jgi:quinohemoprotein ethanol dehydrogenase
VLTFALGGKDRLPAPAPPPGFPDDTGFAVDPAKALKGQGIFAQRCAICHGAAALAGGAAPDLLRSTVPLDAAAIASVLHGGALAGRGMPRFAELTGDEIAQIQAYLRQRAHEVQTAEAGQAKLNRGRDEGQ